MKREFLTELGLETEQVNKIMAEHGRTVNSLKDEADKAKEDASELKSQLSDRDTQLEELGKKVKGNEELEQKIKELQESNENVTKEYQDKLNKQAFDFALERTLVDAQAKNPKAVKALLNTDAIKLDGEKLLGLEEQLKNLKESDGYLFVEKEEPSLKGRKPNDSKDTPVGLTKDQFNQMSYQERMDLYNKDLETYQKLTN